MRVKPPCSSGIRISCPRPAARVRLICIPFAGSSANSYREWSTYLPAHVEVVPIPLPGRGNHLDEPATDSAEMLAGRVLDGLVSYLDRPFALFGHGMGALIAFELARQLRAKGVEPVQVFASGCKAPRVPSDLSKHHPPLRCPISAFGGLQDREVNKYEIEAWSGHTVGPFQAHMLPGDHCFVNSSRRNLLRLMTQQLSWLFAAKLGSE